MNNGNNGNSRQIQRKQDRDRFKQNKTEQKLLNSAVLRRELVPLLQKFQLMQQRVDNQDLIIAALYNMVIEKNIVTEKEMENFHKFEIEKLGVLQKIQTTESDYENRLESCIKYKIPIDKTVIPIQIKEDIKLSTEEKLELANKYEIAHDLIIEKTT